MDLSNLEGVKSDVIDELGNCEIRKAGDDGEECLWTYVSKEQALQFLQSSEKMEGVKGQVGQLYQLSDDDRVLWKGQSVVMKSMKVSKWWQDWFEKLGIKMKKNLSSGLFKNCDYLVNILGFCDSVPELLLIFMEKCDSSVRDGIGPDSKFSYKDRVQILLETARAIEYLHRNKTVHCDLKWSNVLMKNAHAKLCDFDQTKSSEKPPEQQGGFDPKKSNLLFYDVPSTDIRAFGVMVKCLLFNNVNQRRVKICEEEIRKYGVSEQMVDLIGNCSNGTILSMTQVCKILEEELGRD